MKVTLFTLSLFVLTHRAVCTEFMNDGIATSYYSKDSTVSLWPMPASVAVSKDSQPIDAMLFHFRTITHSCDILEAAFIRYIGIIFHGKPSRWNRKLSKPEKQHSSQPLLSKSKISNNGLTALHVAVQNECEKWPSLEMDESCESSVFV